MTPRLKPPLRTAESLVRSIRLEFARTVLSAFEHAPYPLERTLDHPGDPGLLGPDSMSWRVIADPAAIVGGIRGLLIQAAHPEVVAGVIHHSHYREDPLGRLSRTSAYVTATTFGAAPEVEKAVRQVRRAHREVKGVSSRGIHYDAADPFHSAWVHNALVDSFLTVNQAYAELSLTAHEADRFVAEQTRVGALLGADPMPTNARDLNSWVVDHPDIGSSTEMKEAIDFLTNPPLSLAIKAGYMILMEAAVATIPRRLADILGLKAKPGADLVGRASVSSLRWALGYSPSWALALRRTGADVSPELFRHIPDGI